jgi:AraC family transcriptional regulator of arabinose operon
MDISKEKMDYFTNTRKAANLEQSQKMMRTNNEHAICELLKSAGIRFSSLSEVPLQTIRNAQRGAFPDMRMIDLAPSLRADLLQTPILEDLLCTRIGFQGPSPAHYIPRPAGSDDYILIVCVSGSGWLKIHDQEWTVHPNDAFLIPRHMPHTYGATSDNPWSNYWVHFQGKQGAAFAELIHTERPILHLQQQEEVVACIEQLYSDMSHVHAYSELVAASGALSQLLCLIQFKMRTTNVKIRTTEEALEKTIEFMRKNLSKKLVLDDLAKVAGLSPNYYGMLFNQLNGQTPINYFNRLKIQKACEILSTTKLSINETAERLGFPDPYYFSRLFKKLMGKSPRQYR